MNISEERRKEGREKEGRNKRAGWNEESKKGGKNDKGEKGRRMYTKRVKKIRRKEESGWKEGKMEKRSGGYY